MPPQNVDEIAPSGFNFRAGLLSTGIYAIAKITPSAVETTIRISTA